MTHRQLIGVVTCAFFLFAALSFVMTKPSAQSGTFTSVNVTTGSGPVAVAVNQSTNKIYVTNADSNNVTVIDGTDNSTTTVVAGSFPQAVAVNPMTNKIYVANTGSNDVTVINGADNSTVTVPVGTSPLTVAVSPAPNKIYVANYDSNDVTVIDGTNNSTTTVAVGVEPRGIAVNSVTNNIYVTNQDVAGFGNVTVINGSDNSTTTVATDAHPFGVAVNSVTNKIYVACNGGGVTVIDGTDNSTATVLSPGEAPVELAVNETTNKIYVIASNASDVTVIDGRNNSTTSVSAADGGDDPQKVAVDSGTNSIYVAACGRGCEGGDNVFAIDGSNNSTTGIPTSGSNTVDIAVNPTTHKVYVVNEDSNDVSVITPPSTGNTPTGTNVSVTLGPGVSVTFSQVTAAGDTTAMAVSSPTPPAGFQVDGQIYDISTTATYVPPVTVCLPYSPSDLNPGLFHYENVPPQEWVDRTSSIDTVNHIVCGVVSSLSPLAVLTPNAPPPTPTPTPTPSPAPTPTPVTCTRETVAGEGSIRISGGKDAEFEIEAQAQANRVSGEIEYRDQNLKLNVKSTDLSGVAITGAHAQITGKARINGSGSFDFVIDVDDLGRPGRGVDQFRIQLSNGYVQSGTINKGNIRIRRRSCRDRDGDDHMANSTPEFYRSVFVAAWSLIGSIFMA